MRLSLLQRTNTQDPRTRAITACCASSAAVQYKTPEPMWLRGLVEGHHDGTVAQVADIQRPAGSTSHHFIISTFHFIIA